MSVTRTAVTQELVQTPQCYEMHTDEACKVEVSIIVTDNNESILGPQCATSEYWHPAN
jgi:hypothetical protein